MHLSLLLSLVTFSRGLDIHQSNENPISPLSDWVLIYKYQVGGKQDSVEMDVNLRVKRNGFLGTALDFISFFFPSEFEISLVSGEHNVLYHERISGNSVAISRVLLPETKSQSIEILVKNLNTYFSLTPQLSGEIFTSSEQFDLRTQFASCTFPIYSQQMCGACYADVVAGAGTDDLCISNNGKNEVARLSPQPIISCSSLGGCNGGSPYLAALWVETNGLSRYEDCPYLSGQCSPAEDVERDGCISCNSVSNNFAKVYRFRPIVLPTNSEYAIIKHLQQKGSVMVIFNAHANFQPFFSMRPFAIYTSHEDSPSLGNHAVRLVGFGVKDDVKYWIALNSWGPTWANRGSFKFLRGQNLCYIEQYPVGIESVDRPSAGIPRQSNSRSQPLVGDWQDQDPSNTYWKNFIQQYTTEISHRIGSNNSFIVSSIQTRVGDGYFVKLRLSSENQNYKVIVHVSSKGDSNVSLDSTSVKRERPHPEKVDNVSLT